MANQGTNALLEGIKGILTSTSNEQFSNLAKMLTSELQTVNAAITALEVQITQLIASINSVKAATKPRTTNARAPKSNDSPIPSSIANPTSNVNIYFGSCYKELSEFGDKFRATYTINTLPAEVYKNAMDAIKSLKTFQEKDAPEADSPDLLEYNKTREKIVANLGVVAKTIYAKISKDETFATYWKQFNDDHKNARTALEEQQKKNNRPDQKETEDNTDDEQLTQALDEDEISADDEHPKTPAKAKPKAAPKATAAKAAPKAPVKTPAKAAAPKAPVKAPAKK